MILVNKLAVGEIHEGKLERFLALAGIHSNPLQFLAIALDMLSSMIVCGNK